MKTQLLLAALAGLAALSPLAARAESEVSLEFFYDNLSPYGDWLEVGDYGNCWRPRDVDADWSPYTDGYWSYTDAGWTWISYEDFGDITYHYGRWVRVADVGWCWVPDTEWGPAWVSWRKSDDYVGWAPLPPEARWRPSVGFSVWVDSSYDIGPDYYSFCPIVEFGAPVIRHVCVPRSRVAFFFGNTVNITNITYNSYSHHVFCGGPDYVVINRFARRPVPTLKLVQNTTIVNNNITVINNRNVIRAPRNTIAGNTLQVYAPKVVARPVPPAARPHISQVIAKPKVDKGWASVNDPGEVKKLHEKVKNDTKGLTPDTAPAKPVQLTDLKPLPDKADVKAPSPVQVNPPGGKPVAGGKTKGGKPVPPIATNPAVPATTSPVVPTTPEKPQAPVTLPKQENPNKVAVDQVPKSPKGKGKGAKTVPTNPAPATVTAPQVPAATADNPLRKPFREQPTAPQQPVTLPKAPTAEQPITPQRPITSDNLAPQSKKKGRKPTVDAGPGVDQQEAAAAQRRAEAQRQLQAQSEMRQQQAEAARSRAAQAQQQQADAARARAAQAQQQDGMERRQRAAESAQRQGAMQRQAELQQRQIQAERQQALQRQMQVQRQQPAPKQQQFVPPAQPRPQVMPKAGKGQQLTPEQIEALKKQQGR